MKIKYNSIIHEINDFVYFNGYISQIKKIHEDNLWLKVPYTKKHIRTNIFNVKIMKGSI